MQIIESKPTVKISIFIVTALLALGFIYFLFLPAFRDYSQKRTDVDSQTTVLAQVKTLNEQAKRSIGQLNSNQDQFSVLDVSIPSKPQIADLYAEVEAMAKGANLIFINVQAINEMDPKQLDLSQPDPNDPNPPKAVSPSLAELQLSFEVKGSQQGVQQMLTSMERSMRFLDVQTIDISRDQNNSDIDYKFAVKAYYQKDSK